MGRYWAAIVAASITCTSWAQIPGSDIWLIALQDNTDSKHAALKVADTWVKVTDAPFYHNQPYFTADDSLVYYTGSDASGQTDFYRYDIASGNTVNVTQSTTSEYSPTPVPNQEALSGIWVDDNGKQWLRQWSLSTDDTRQLLPIDPIGYHVWLNNTDVLVFVLGTSEEQPHTLQRWSTLGDAQTGDIVDNNIGASLWAIPNQADKFSYSKLENEQHWLMQYDAKTKQTQKLTKLPESSAYYAWTPDGKAVTVSPDSEGLIYWQYGSDSDWQPFISITSQCKYGASRLVFSNNTEQLALVCNRG
ncbi:TolB family protein [Alteromonas facilis]|uniref:TolB family protein n=1 Tax=Alteromonas facilis TaxID=2048004 RepID=UPI000C287DFC|nr:hypothetical protein [Alteromonas facilis]